MDICCQGDYSKVVTGSATLLHPEIYFHLWRHVIAKSVFCTPLSPVLGKSHTQALLQHQLRQAFALIPRNCQTRRVGGRGDVRRSRIKIMTTDRLKKSWDVMLVI